MFNVDGFMKCMQIEDPDHDQTWQEDQHRRQALPDQSKKDSIQGYHLIYYRMILCILDEIRDYSINSLIF